MVGKAEPLSMATQRSIPLTLLSLDHCNLPGLTSLERTSSVPRERWYQISDCPDLQETDRKCKLGISVSGEAKGVNMECTLELVTPKLV